MMPKMLASAASLDEACLLSGLGIDILDLKNPLEGALGGLPVDLVLKIVETCPERTISATIGDLPMEGALVGARVKAMAATGVDFVKIGFFGSTGWSGVLSCLKPLAMSGIRLVAVFFADQEGLELSDLRRFREAGFAGVMLDTAEKRQGSLLCCREESWIRAFLTEARSCDLMTGLAGSLGLNDLPVLKTIGADYLGFRGALCSGGRTGDIDPGAVGRVLEVLRAPVAVGSSFVL